MTLKRIDELKPVRKLYGYGQLSLPLREKAHNQFSSEDMESYYYELTQDGNGILCRIYIPIADKREPQNIIK